MDKVKAEIWDRQLRGKEVGGYKVDRLIDHGKSAAVFLAEKSGEKFALKIFDDELIERYGDAAQIARIDEELKLIGCHHPNMVKIVAGGVDQETNSHYVVMEYLDGPSLRKCLKDVPPENVPGLVAQLASAARFLEELGLVHRDIKPENIILIDNYSVLKLLDFGVIRHIGKPGVTDDNGIQAFVGTLQYSSPEFLIREEVDSVDGWRALTFYQIGGVIHDLLMRKGLFEEHVNPYARLVNAVQNEPPVIDAPGQPHRLTHIAACCLIKRPDIRLSFLCWEDFELDRITSAVHNSSKQRVLDRLALQRVTRQEQVRTRIETDAEKASVAKNVLDFLGSATRSIRRGVLPPVTIRRRPHADVLDISFAPSIEHSLPSGMTLSVRVAILDATDQAMILDAAAFSTAPTAHLPDDFSDFKAFYEGVADYAAISGAFEECVYRYFESNQQP